MTTFSSKSQTPENLVGGHYRVGATIREDPLGLLCRAEDTRADNRPVTLLKLKQIITLLPPNTKERLSAAMKEANSIGIPTLLQVEESDLAQLYTAMSELKSEVTLAQWAQRDQRRPPLEIIRLVTLIAYAVDYPVRNAYKWVRPSLDPSKIYIQPDSGSLAGDYPVLTDLGFAELLLDNPAYSNGMPMNTQTIVHQLAILLANLLLGEVDLRGGDWADKAFAETQVNKISNRHPNLPRGWRGLLLTALPSAVDEHFATPGTLAEALKKLTDAPVPPFILGSRPVPAEPPNAPEAKPSVSPTIVGGKTQPVATPAAAITQPLAGAQVGAQLGTRTAKYRLEVYDRATNDAKLIDLQDNVVTNGIFIDDQIPLPRLAPQRLYLVRQEGRLAERYTITDTGNGATTYSEFALLDGTPLSPYYAALFPEHSRLTIAGYEIELLPTLDTVTSVPPQAAPPLQVAVRDYAAQPGERLTLPIHLQNQTNEVDRLWLVLDGAPDEWRIMTPAARQFFKGEEADLQIGIRLPPVPQSVARVYTLTLRLISENLSAQIAALNLQVELLPAYDYVGLLTPQNLRIGAAGKLTIENHGNLSRVFRLAWRDGAGELLFDPSDTTLLVRAGEEGEVIFRTYPRQWRWFGREKSHNITVLATPQSGGLAQTYMGQVISRALIPAWALPAVLLLALCFFLLATLFLKPEFASRAITPGDAAVAATPFTLTWRSVNTCFASVYENGIVRKPFTWQPGAGLYWVEQPKADDVVEVRLRNCFFMAEKSWAVPVVTPTPTPIGAPQIISFTLVSNPVVTPTLHLLLGQMGELCLHWAVSGAYKTLKLEPPLAAWGETSALPSAQGALCSPIAPLFEREENHPRKSFKLVALWGDGQQITSAPVEVEVKQARCYVNTVDPAILN
jgi:hypothetical protein